MLYCDLKTTHTVSDRDGIVGGADSCVAESTLNFNYRLSNCCVYLIYLEALLVSQVARQEAQTARLLF